VSVSGFLGRDDETLRCMVAALFYIAERNTPLSLGGFAFFFDRP
jgi:hypothetical protein